MQSRLIIATEALATGDLTRRGLMRSYNKIHRNVYAPAGLELTALDRAHAGWLWSGRKAMLAGHSAAALLGAKWIPPDAPVELARVRRPAARGIHVYSGHIEDDEVCEINGISCITAARTAYDLGRRLPLETGVIRIDALLNATKVSIGQVDSMKKLRVTLDLADGGAESPQETRARLALVQSGMARPVTPNPCHEQRLEFLAAKGWLIARVSARQLRYQREVVVRRVCNALAHRGCPL